MKETEKQIKKRNKIYNEYNLNNIIKLKELSWYKYRDNIYDNYVDNKDNEIFINRIMNQIYLYFIIVDEYHNIFWYFHNSKIISSNNDNYKWFNKTNIIFIFKLYKNWEIDTKKFKKYNMNIYINLFQ